MLKRGNIFLGFKSQLLQHWFNGIIKLTVLVFIELWSRGKSLLADYSKTQWSFIVIESYALLKALLSYVLTQPSLIVIE